MGHALDRAVLLGSPGAVVLVVSVALLGFGRERPVLGARLHGGPTEGVRTLAWRIEVVEAGRAGRVTTSRDVRIEARADPGPAVSWSGRTDGDGLAEARLALATPAHDGMTVRITSGAALLAEGRVRLDRDAWNRTARRRGGSTAESGGSHDGLALRVALARGALAVPFTESVIVELTRRGAPVAGARVETTADGGDVERGTALTDARGRARFRVTPREHSASFAVRARAPDGGETSLTAALAIVPGALHARIDERRVVVESPIERERAYVSFSSPDGRHGGGTVALVADGRGGARGVVDLPPGDVGPLWAIVSSEPDRRSPALVGWSLAPSDDEPITTFDTPDAMLLDGVAAAARRERERVTRVRWGAAATSVAGLALTLGILRRVVQASRRDAAGLRRHLEAGASTEDGQRAIDERRPFAARALAAPLVLGIGFALLAAYALSFLWSG